MFVFDAIRRQAGPEKFDRLMDEFGRQHAGRPTELSEVFPKEIGDRLNVSVGRLMQDITAQFPKSAYVIQSFHSERDRTLIVYGTLDEEAANRATANAVQEVIRKHRFNDSIPVVADRQLTSTVAKDRHLILIGRPDSNVWVEQVHQTLPIHFGHRSFSVIGEQYAHAGTAVLAATDNPHNTRYSVVVLAGLSADATARTPELLFAKGTHGADVLISAHGAKPRAIVSTAKK